jgi:hypothetical protein
VQIAILDAWDLDEEIGGPLCQNYRLVLDSDRPVVSKMVTFFGPVVGLGRSEKYDASGIHEIHVFSL